MGKPTHHLSEIAIIGMVQQWLWMKWNKVLWHATEWKHLPTTSHTYPEDPQSTPTKSSQVQGEKSTIADANLSNIAVSYIKALIGWNVPTWIVDNTYTIP